MPEFFNTFQLLGGHNNQTPSLLPPLGGTLTFKLTMNAQGQSDAIPMPTIPFSSYDDPSESVDPLGRSFVGEIGNDVPSAVSAFNAGQNYWGIDGPLAGNTGDSIVKLPLTAVGRNAPSLALQVTGDALTAAKEAGDVDSVRGSLQWAYSPSNPYQTLVQIGEFTDATDNVENKADATVELTAIQNQLTQPTAQHVLGVNGSGSVVKLDECSFAALGPDARVWIEAGDIGPLPEQIPVSVTDNTAANFRFHPSTFLRRTRYVRSTERCYADPKTLTLSNDGTQPINIQSITTPLLKSRWLIVVDGVTSIVDLDHGGADIKRPKDIWQQVWVPLITGGQSLGDLTILGGGAVQSDPNIAPAAGSLLVGPEATQLRLTYLSYARFIQLGFSDITQTDTGQP